MTVQHTPTPWQHIPFEFVYKDEIRIVDHTCNKLPKEEQEANARHIVKCVNEQEELIRSLQDVAGSLEIVLDNVSEFHLKNSHRWDAKSAINRAKQALAKAEEE